MRTLYHRTGMPRPERILKPLPWGQAIIVNFILALFCWAVVWFAIIGALRVL